MQLMECVIERELFITSLDPVTGRALTGADLRPSLAAKTSVCVKQALGFV